VPTTTSRHSEEYWPVPAGGPVCTAQAWQGLVDPEPELELLPDPELVLELDDDALDEEVLDDPADDEELDEDEPPPPMLTEPEEPPPPPEPVEEPTGPDVEEREVLDEKEGGSGSSGVGVEIVAKGRVVGFDAKTRGMPGRRLASERPFSMALIARTPVCGMKEVRQLAFRASPWNEES